MNMAVLMNPKMETIMVEVTHQKCACADCVCIVEVKNAVKKSDRAYCSATCADGHPSGAGCNHAGCACHG